MKKAVDALKRISAVKCDTPLGGLFQNAELPVDATCSMRFSADLFKSSGKGLSPAQCRASAVMEYVERYSWLHFNYRKAKGFIQASYNDLKNTHPTIHPDYFICNLIHPKDPEYLTARISSLPMKWINAVSMKNGTPFLYPLNWHNYVLGSNGLAAGNNRHKAMLQALCAVVERENIYRFFGEARPAPVLDPSSVSHPGSLRLMAQANKAGIELITRYIGFDFGIPTFIVRGVFRAHPESLWYKGVGQGTHPDPEKALIRALTEYFEGMSQTRDMEKKLLENPGTHHAAEKKLNWQQFLANHSRPMHGGFIANYRPDMMTRAAGAVSMKDIANLSHGDIRVELNRLADILAGHGHDIYVVDKTHPEIVHRNPIFFPGDSYEDAQCYKKLKKNDLLFEILLFFC
ncbi:YcaO-like family protein [Desulfobacter vibrioformis]|uniref:YcaO-like family protein n=1 Tax=Desulfobacter vibrioformis TaxID=34031 RepID=UPI000553D526|nr:YcaO-like family protein [Desulfobacter vibrioformis]